MRFGENRRVSGKIAEVIQNEHRQLMRRLSELDAALEGLACYSEVYANLASAPQIQAASQWLSEWLPSHFLREENTLFTHLAALGPEAAAFTRDMKRQHEEIGRRLQAFSAEAEQLRQSQDLEQSVVALKQFGADLTSFIAKHMKAEDKRFATKC
ncbi:MAG: hemerythrin domain-containing protein [Terriglobales bacterium]